MEHILLLIILLILLIEFGLGRWLSYLNIKHSKLKLPAVLADIYDTEKYARQQDYFRTNARFGMLTASFSFVVIVAIYACGGFGWFDGIVQNWTEHGILQSLLFFGVLFIASDRNARDVFRRTGWIRRPPDIPDDRPCSFEELARGSG